MSDLWYIFGIPLQYAVQFSIMVQILLESKYGEMMNRERYPPDKKGGSEVLQLVLNKKSTYIDSDTIVSKSVSSCGLTRGPANNFKVFAIQLEENEMACLRSQALRNDNSYLDMVCAISICIAYVYSSAKYDKKEAYAEEDDCEDDECFLVPLGSVKVKICYGEPAKTNSDGTNSDGFVVPFPRVKYPVTVEHEWREWKKFRNMIRDVGLGHILPQKPEEEYIGYFDEYRPTAEDYCKEKEEYIIEKMSAKGGRKWAKEKRTGGGGYIESELKRQRR